jgi:RimJ/RimL family protein N-acetyltransferase
MPPSGFPTLLASLCLLVETVSRGAPATIVGRAVNIAGTPFQMRGICYNPVPIGLDGRQAPHADFFTPAWRELYLRDLPKMRQMGVNTVRIYGWAPGADHREFLDLAWNSGRDPIRVLISQWVDPYTDWNSPAAVAALKEEWSSIALAARDHPATFGYLVGNELNLARWNRSLPDLWPAWNEVAAGIRQQDTNHFITTALADSALLENIREGDLHAPNLTVWCVQAYRGTGFKTLFKDYSAVTKKPLFVTEFGMDAYNTRTRQEYPDNAAVQADMVTALWQELATNSGIVSGGCVFEWSDEWWKQGRAVDHDVGGWPNGAFPDGQADEEWWGIHRVASGNVNSLEPRAVAAKLKQLWAPTPPADR